jgi:hypothetical protein
VKEKARGWERRKSASMACREDMVLGLGGVTCGALVVISYIEAFLVHSNGGMSCEGVCELCRSSRCGHEGIKLSLVSSSWPRKAIAKPHLQPLGAFLYLLMFLSPTLLKAPHVVS